MSPHEQLIDIVEVTERLHLSQRSVWRLRDAGKMPAPLKIGAAVRWRESEISAWIAAGCPDCRRTGWTPETAQSVTGGAR